MPWTAADADRHIKGLTDEQKQQWASVANSALSRCQREGGADCEGAAIRQANGAVGKVDFSFDMPIAKADEDQHLVFGWLSVSKDAQGNLIVDSQGDIIEPGELEKAAYNFTLYAREAGEMHQRIGIGKLVESMVFTVEKQQALGIPQGAMPVGWWVGMKITDEAVWQKVKDGTYRAFSIGGRGKRVEVSGNAD